MDSTDIRRIIRILDDVESSLGNAMTYVNRAIHDVDDDTELRRARSSIDSAISELDDAKRKLKRLG